MSDKMREAFANLCKECGPTISFFDFEMGWDAALAEQSAELERLRKDAERYRWIRDANNDPGGVIDIIPHPGMSLYRAESELDNAIDAAIAAEGEK